MSFQKVLAVKMPLPSSQVATTAGETFTRVLAAPSVKSSTLVKSTDGCRAKLPASILRVAAALVSILLT